MENTEIREQLNEALKDFYLVQKAPSRYFTMLQSLGYCKISDKSETWELIGKANAEILSEIRDKGQLRTEKGQQRIRGIKGITQSDPKSIPDFVLQRVKEIKIREFFRTLSQGFKF